jgi:hypothetical protein
MMKLLLTFVASILFATPLGLSGCTSHVEVLPDNPPTPVPVATVAAREHAVAILGIDFDPPLDYAQAMANSDVILTAALKNQGTSDEPEVRVSARLVDASRQELLHETVVVRALRAGEMRQVRFTQVPDLPALQNHYQLIVELDPVKGETDTRSHSRTFDIVVRSDN